MKLKKLTDWWDVKEAALRTAGKEPKTPPDSAWKYRLLYAEHSPIRALTFKWVWDSIKYWVSVHFVRHKIGVEHFVRSQRTDRTGLNRDLLPQDAEVSHTMILNAQAVINISRKRLCNRASRETREKWIEFLNYLRAVEPELYDLCVPECLYRGFCPEMICCTFADTAAYRQAREQYINRCLALRIK